MAACTKPTAEETPSFAGNISFLVEPSIHFEGEGGTAAVRFRCDNKWQVVISEEDATWLSVNEASGEATGARKTLTFTAEANTGNSRETTVSLISGTTKERIAVSQAPTVLVLSQNDVPNLDKYWKPREFNYDMFRSDATWSWCRSAQSEHFFVFWAKGYGEYGLYGERVGMENSSPKTLDPSNPLYVDIDDLLEKAEEFYRVNINELKFADTSTGKSNLNKYKMEIYILHQTEWLATGSGYDNMIGALWINPATCHPVGSTIGHEIGHSFQYMVYADAIANGAPNDFSTGFRYEIGQGCGFWEQCAQWQSFQTYAAQAFGGDLSVFVENCHRHFTHEHQRYASYWLQWHWASKYGVEEIGKIWRGAKKPEDPIEAYQRMHGLSMDELNADLYDYAAHCVTWDFSVEATNFNEGQLTGVTQPIRDFGKNYIGKIGWKSNWDKTTGFYTVDYSRAPEATGFNHIRLNIPENRQLSVRFEGLPNATGFNPVKDASVAGWNVGFIALMKDGSRQYSNYTRVRTSADIAYTVPENAAKIWMVVSATPESYVRHLWDEDNTNDEQWPYRVKFTGTDLFGNLNFDGTETPKNISIEHDITTSAAAGYAGTSYTLEDDHIIEIAKAFVMQPSEIIAAIPQDRTNVQSGTVKIAAIEKGVSVSYNYTANGYGFWYGADGTVQPWNDAYVYLEYDPSSWTCQFGVHPNKVSGGQIKAGDSYTIQMAFVYKTYKAILKFNITVTA